MPKPEILDSSLIQGEVKPELVSGITDLISKVHQDLPRAIEMGRESPAKIPEKVDVLIHALAYRVADLSRAYAREANARSLTPCFLLARALMEAACLAYDIAARVSEIVKVGSTEKLSDLDVHLTRVMHGAKSKVWRPEEDDPEAVNVLTILDRTVKTLGPGLRQNFEDISEFAHPNAAGVMSSYGDLDTDRQVFTFCAEPARSELHAVAWHMRSATLSLAVFDAARKLWTHHRRGCVSICEREIFEHGTWPKGVQYPLSHTG